jgi:curved DNA-binding protein CbpA
VTERLRDPYAILGVPRGASREEIGRAYRALAKRSHPDAGGAAAPAMQDLNWAWELLSDPRRRADWDRVHRRLSTPAGHWANDGATAARSEAFRRDAAARPDQDWMAQPGWTFSGEAWGGAGAPAAEQQARFGCVGLTLLVLALCGFVLFGAFLSGYESPYSEPPVQQGTPPPAP